jgi:hypothetical protein
MTTTPLEPISDPAVAPSGAPDVDPVAPGTPDHPEPGPEADPEES